MYYIKNEYINNEIMRKKLKDKYEDIVIIIEKKNKEENKIKDKNKIKEIEEKYKNEINEMKKKVSNNIYHFLCIVNKYN